MAFPVAQIETLVYPERVQQLPQSPDYILGILPYLDEVLVLLDLTHFLGLKAPTQAAEPTPLDGSLFY